MVSVDPIWEIFADLGVEKLLTIVHESFLKGDDNNDTLRDLN